MYDDFGPNISKASAVEMEKMERELERETRFKILICFSYLGEKEDLPQGAGGELHYTKKLPKQQEHLWRSLLNLSPKILLKKILNALIANQTLERQTR